METYLVRGVKKCSTAHFLAQTLHRILEGIENKMIPTVLSNDFQKAFNRMSHQACLREASKKGASKETLRAIYNFLHGRTIKVRAAGAESTSLPVNGGSPQGSILGNYLFCLTTDALDDCEGIDWALAELVKYIDDFNVIEWCDPEEAVLSISRRKTEADVRACQSQAVFTAVQDRAEELGMRVNAKKTKLLCINSDPY